eukprot:2258739-Rhodomonas_salina.6
MLGLGLLCGMLLRTRCGSCSTDVRRAATRRELCAYARHLYLLAVSHQHLLSHRYPTYALWFTPKHPTYALWSCTLARLSYTLAYGPYAHIGPYALAMRCPVLTAAMLLPAATECVACDAPFISTDPPSAVASLAICLRACWY